MGLYNVRYKRTLWATESLVQRLFLETMSHAEVTTSIVDGNAKSMVTG
jgi:hypothetical protein